MSNARRRTITVRVKAGDGQFEAKGKTIEFAACRRYVADTTILKPPPQMLRFSLR